MHFLRVRKRLSSPRRCPSLVFKHLPSLKAATHGHGIPRRAAVPAITSLPSRQKSSCANKHSNRYERDGHARGHMMGRLERESPRFFFFSLAQRSRGVQQGKKTLLTSRSYVAGRRKASERRGRLSQADTDDQKWDSNSESSKGDTLKCNVLERALLPAQRGLSLKMLLCPHHCSS